MLDCVYFFVVFNYARWWPLGVAAFVVQLALPGARTTGTADVLRDLRHLSADRWAVLAMSIVLPCGGSILWAQQSAAARICTVVIFAALMLLIRFYLLPPRPARVAAAVDDRAA